MRSQYRALHLSASRGKKEESLFTIHHSRLQAIKVLPTYFLSSCSATDQWKKQP